MRPSHFLASLTLFMSLFLISPGKNASAQAVETEQLNGAVIIMYHRFDQAAYPTTNIPLELLRSHIQLLKSGPYTVLSLSEITDALKEGRQLPDRTIGITVDDAFASFYNTGWKEFQKAGLPVTVFVSTEPVEQNQPDYMSWTELREIIADPLISIGNHAHQHQHMADLTPEEQKASIDQANELFRRALGKQPDIFSYPYGEVSSSLVQVVKESGFKAAFGQHSGTVSRTDDLFQLPRFTFNERFGAIERFKLAINTLPLPVLAVLPENPMLDKTNNPPNIGFTISPEIGTREDGSYPGLNCYSSQNDVSLMQLGGGRIEVRLSAPFTPGRARLNCTMLGPDKRWRWFGQQYYIPE
ncbi:polysaccharide deacetylase family protein [Kiloniella laminariae]|uniref:Chitooligosaccharide deacetylase n=1 Tax=Kiloniella laminariae TaxID=454162 RepID=A0ABT4LJP0_9PROT|nr:polysaccharide deacetylase family protein [Kiloniella laminariae]MCZ4281297.1 polysaccharide deacetylase family protein [Kiloniella laminariae]